MSDPQRVAVVGGGVMGEALLAAVLRSGVPADAVMVAEKSRARADALAATHGVATTAHAPDAVRGADAVIIAVKPDDVAGLLLAIAPVLTGGALVVTVVAGLPIAFYEKRLPPGTPVVRVMPNTPAVIGAGAAGMSAGTAASTGHLTLTLVSIHESESLLAFVILSFFLLVYARYRTLSPGIFVFPLAFLLTFASSIAQGPPLFDSKLMRSGWIFAHIALIFTGYAALFLSFGASILYLLQERSIKSKQADSLLGRLPALEVLDDIGFRALLFGFPFMTLGLLAGSVIAQEHFGPMYFLDPKILLSLLMWVVYMVLLYTRWNSGWRGKRAAYLATFAFIAAVSAWAANYFSGVHRFVAP